ncbi:MAG: 50S ribosomal protein L23, partial [Anaerolineaceae bacterium]
MSTIYDVLRRPIVTEKTNYMVTKLHQYVFEVSDDANRTLVKDAVEKLFNVTVVRVNIINVPA